MAHIIDSRGIVHFVPDAPRRRPQGANRFWHRLAAITTGIILLPFLCAAGAGIYLGIRDGLPKPATAAPAAHSIALPKPLPAALRACRTAPRQYQGYCIGLYLRPAYTLTQADGTKIHTPAGPALVKECMTQGLDHSELGYCLTQPIG